MISHFRCLLGSTAQASLSAGSLLLCLGMLYAEATPVLESARQIPVAADVDIVIAGGSTAAVSAAVEAKRSGANVYLVAARPYVGEDLCATQRLWLEEGEVPRSDLAKRIYGSGRATTPLRVKSEMDRALLQAEIPYLTGCYATEMLVDETGDAAGIVMVNRSGRQAIRAKVVIDATRHAVIARQGAATFRKFVPGKRPVRFIVVGGKKPTGGLRGRMLNVTFNSHLVHECTISVSLPDGSYASLARAEQAVRTKTFAKGMVDMSETLLFMPSSTLVGRTRQEAPWPGAAACDLASFTPKRVDRLYVLSAQADIEQSAAEKMLRPLEFMALGQRIGRAAAEEAKKLDKLGSVELAGSNRRLGPTRAEVREDLEGLRPSDLGAIRVAPRILPILGAYDVVVVGGGTSGAPAGIAAARQGARTLVIEYLDELGGVGTAGLIGKYWYGLRVGFTKEIDAAVGAPGWKPVAKSEWFRQELQRLGADVWFRSFGCGALVEGSQVKGVVVATPQGRGVVLAEVVIDATGNSDVAHCAGAATQFSISSHGSLSVQLAGYPHRNLGDSYNNTCFTMVDDTDAFDIWHLMTYNRLKNASKKKTYDMAQLVDSRDRRRIVGDYMMTTQDILSRRTFPDTVSRHKSNFDAAAFPDSLLLLIKDMKGPVFEADVPYRCMLPKGLEGILVVGLGTSTERDAMTLVRMQPDLQNQGYAAGVAAAMAVLTDGQTRRISIKALQKHLIEVGNLPARVATDTDSHPMDAESVAEAVRRVAVLSRKNTQNKADADKQPYRELAIILAHHRQALPLLRKAWQDATGKDEKLNYALILGFLGDGTAVSTLLEALDGTEAWDSEKHGWLSSGRKSGNVFSEMDRIVMALGFSRAPEAVAPLIEKVKQLDPHKSETSHFKAIALALRQFDSLPNTELVEPLTLLLKRLGDRATSAKKKGELLADRRPLNPAFKEQIVAGMLLRCGDPDAMAQRVFDAYRNAYNGHFARYARENSRPEKVNETNRQDARDGL